MTKLIVEEGGSRRAFRIGKGVLTVGSGAEARLRLTSPDVAEIHLELELSERGVRLRARPGVVAPRVAGQNLEGETRLAANQMVEIGGARLWLEAEPAAAGAAAASRPSPAPARAPGAGPAARARTGRRSLVDAAPRRTARGLPPRAVVGIILVVTALALFVWWAQLSSKAADVEPLARQMARAAGQKAAAGDLAGAVEQLAEIPRTGLDGETRALVEQLERDFEARRQVVEATLANQSGTRYLDTLLKKYEARYLSGSPEPAKARLFLKRCRTFRERWPGHPEVDWVRRQEARFAGYVDLSAPPTWADVQWEVQDLTDGSPRNYLAAFGLLDEFLGRAAGGEATEAQGLRDRLASERVEYARDRLFQAQYEYDKKKDASKAVWWLVNSVAWLGDEALANEAARYLLRMPDLAGHLLGYKQDYPDRYELVLENPLVAAWAREQGFSP